MEDFALWVITNWYRSCSMLKMQFQYLRILDTVLMHESFNWMACWWQHLNILIKFTRCVRSFWRENLMRSSKIFRKIWNTRLNWWWRSCCLKWDFLWNHNHFKMMVSLKQYWLVINYFGLRSAKAISIQWLIPNTNFS